jgi:dephospho-CoA kinase
MITIGLTGGSGSGKGYISSLFAAAGVPVLDTDAVSRLVCMPGSDCLAELAERFGSSILLPDGSLDRRRLASLAFADSESTAALNAITHRHILAYCRRWLDMLRVDGAPAAIIDAPQLYESGFDAECDAVIAVVADCELRISRILARDGITREQAEQRLSRQHDDGFFRAHADFIIENNYDAGHPDNGALQQRVYEILSALGLTEGAR